MLSRRLLSVSGQGVWYDGAYAAWQAKGAASLAASYLDLSGNGRDLSVGVAPTWDSVNGWSFNGITQYLNTGIIQLAQTWTMLIRFSNRVKVTTSIEIGAISSAPTRRSLLFASYVSGNSAYSNGNDFFFSTQRTGGVAGIAYDRAYWGGVDVGTIPITGSNSPSSILIGAASLNGVPTGYSDASIQLVGLWDMQLAPAVITAKSAQMAAL